MDRDQAAQKNNTSLNDGARATIIALANLLGLIATAAIFYWTLGAPFEFSLQNTYTQLCFYHAVLIVLFCFAKWPLTPLHIVLVIPCGIFLLFRLLSNWGKPAPDIFPSWLKARNSRTRFRLELWVLVLVNFVYVLFLISKTGGLVASPFTSYAVVMVALGQFIADEGHLTRVMLGVSGIIFFVALRYYGPVDPSAEPTATATLIVMSMSLFISTTITINRS